MSSPIEVAFWNASWIGEGACYPPHGAHWADPRKPPHPRSPAAGWLIRMFDALMVSGTLARSVEVNRVLFEQTAAYRDRQGQEWGVPVWEFAVRSR